MARITPAHAGKTSRCALLSVARSDHPRACGENTETVTPRFAQSGSPPRMRGKPTACRGLPSLLRITPAHAGKTRHREIENRYDADHPRACGENRFIVGIGTDVPGSPPRMRGKLRS